MADPRGPGAATSPSLGLLLLEAAAVLLVAALLYALLVSSLENVHLVTTNGLWKSLKVATFVEDPAGSASPSNLIYYPITGILTWLAPEAWFGPFWLRMAYLNALWAGIALACLWVIVRTLGGGRLTAAAAVLFQAGCGFFLALGITNEDIMGGYALMLASITCAVWGLHREGRGGTLATVLAALLFDLCWFWEWRLLFPIAPAFAVALVAGTAPPRLKVRRALLFVAVASSLLLSAAILANHFHERSVMRWVYGLLWTGKGVGTGWGGFAARKWAFLWIGMTQYWVGGVNIGQLEYLQLGANLLRSAAVLAAEIALGLFLLALGVRRWRDGAWRTFGFLAGGTFLGGQMMNLYSQPQDPQMQINPMFWLPVAWGFAIAALVPRRARFSSVAGAAALAASAVWLPLNLFATNGFWSLRGGDSQMLTQVHALAEQGDLDRTLYIFNGFEGILSWIAVEVGWKYPPTLEVSPQANPRFKGLFLLEQATEYSNLSGEESAALVAERLADAERRGFRIVVNEVWEWDEAKFVDSFSTVSSPEKPRAIFRTLHGRYEGVPVFQIKGLGAFYRLQRRPGDDVSAHAADPEG